MIQTLATLTAVTIVVPLSWYHARRRVRWHNRGVLDIVVSGIYFALVFVVAAYFQGSLS